MLKIRRFARPSATAIAAVLALSSTPVLAQEVTAPTDAPAAAEPSPAPAAGEPAATSSETVTTTTVTESETGATAAPVVKRSTRTVTRTSARPAAAPVAARANAAPPPPATAPATPDMAATAPIEPAAPIAAETPAPVTEPTASAAAIDGDAVEYAFGGALAALVIGGAALAATRRRRRSRDEHLGDSLAVAPAAPAAPVARHDPVPQAGDHHRSAFVWGQQAPDANRMTPTALAKMGPTADNPSLSLKKRLKRAAFFEQRERSAAAGDAVPVARAAGLPQRAVESLRNAASPTSYRPTLQPA